jgi:hypothetical protein
MGTAIAPTTSRPAAGLGARLPGLLVALLLLGSAGLAQAGCPTPRVTPARNLRLAADSALIVTHATSTNDARLSTKRGVDEATRFARGRGIPIVYLVDDSPSRYQFTEDCEPDHWVYSEGGEIDFDFTPSHLYVAGGHLEVCLSRTLHDVLLQWSRRPERDLTVTYFMDAVYSNGRSVDENDRFQADFQRFLGIVTYGRPSGEHWPKLTLLELLGVILDLDDIQGFLERILPGWRHTFPSHYRVELKVNDWNARVLQRGGDPFAPKLLFHFVDSALLLDH